jgi:hypothetical protein
MPASDDLSSALPNMTKAWLNPEERLFKSLLESIFDNSDEVLDWLESLLLMGIGVQKKGWDIIMITTQLFIRQLQNLIQGRWLE